MKRNNRGFTLVELIVVIAIMAVVAAVITVSVGSVASNDARMGANNINSAVSRVRTMCLGRTGNVYLVIQRDTDTGKVMGYYYEGDNDFLPDTDHLVDTRELCSARVKAVSCGDTVLDEADPTASIIVSFNRETGALASPEKTTDTYCLISVSGASVSFGVRIYYATGSHSFVNISEGGVIE